MRSLVLAVLYSHEIEAASVPALAPWVRLSRRVIRTALHHTAYSFGDALVTPLAADLEARYGTDWMEQPDIAALAERIRQVLLRLPTKERTRP
jgi:hypothetical protein